MALRRVGFFRELRHGDRTGPSIKEAVRQSPWQDEDRLLDYLKAGNLFVASPGVSDDVLDPSKTRVTPFHLYTDGEWIWPYDLVYYIENYHVVVPPEFIEHASEMGWKPPELSRDDLIRLEEEILRERNPTS